MKVDGGEKKELESVLDPQRPAGVHNIIKHPKHIGVCLDCGLRGDWESIKSTPCPGKAPTLEAVGMVEATKTEGQALQDEGEEREEAEPAPGGDEVDEQCLDEDDVMEEAAVVLEMLALEEEQYALEYEELQLIELLAKERAQEPLKGGHDRRPPATPCTSVSMPPVHELAVKGSLFWQGSSRCGLGC